MPNTYRSRYVYREGVGTGIVDTRGEQMVRESVSCLDFRPERSEKADRKRRWARWHHLPPPPYPISALYILNHFAFALYAYRLRGKRLKKAAADSGQKKENENGSARVFEGEESVRRERKISLTFEDLRVSTLFHIPIWLILPLCVRYMCVCVYR